jgi:hypothetical protein
VTVTSLHLTRDPPTAWEVDMTRRAVLAGVVAMAVALLTVSSCTGGVAPDPTAVAQAVAATLTAWEPATIPPPFETPSRTLPSTAAPIATPGLPTAQLPTATPVSEPSDAPIPTTTPTLASMATAIPTPMQPIAVVQSDALNLRAGPGTGHPVRATATHGEELIVLGRTEDGSWLKVRRSSGVTAWVASWLVEVSTDVSSLPIPAAVPTPPPIQGKAQDQVSGSRDLELSFMNLHYECVQGEWGTAPKLVWGYRGFQVDLYIKNLGDTPVEAPWKPTRWVITDGENEYVSDVMWEWVSRATGFYDQPTIQPGESAGWTFLAFPIDRNQWVKAVEFEWNGQFYRQEFDLGPFGNAHNYKDCGEPRLHKWRATPTPRG